MKSTTAKMNLKCDQASIKNIKLKENIIRGRQLSYKSIKHVVSAILIATVVFFYFSDSSLMEGLLHYIPPLGTS